jgi:tRNA(Ile)-lysidine synthase
VAEALLRTSAITTGQVAFLDEEVSRLWNDIVQETEGMIILDKGKFLTLHPALKCHLLRAAIEELLGSLKDIEARHIEKIAAVLDKPAGKQVNLPGGLVFVVEYDRYILSLDSVNTCPYPVIGVEYPIDIPGKTELPGWLVEAEIIEPERALKENNECIAYLDLDKAGNELKVRNYRPGDCFQPLGLSQPKKLNRFMIDSRIPRAWRDRIPIVFSQAQIVWLVGYRIDNRAKVTEDTRQVLRLQFRQS